MSNVERMTNSEFRIGRFSKGRHALGLVIRISFGLRHADSMPLLQPARTNWLTAYPRSMSLLRTLLVLGRVSNLPTVWSNCLAGWWLGGGGNIKKLPFLFAGATCLYVGGMFLNDAFDAEFDREYRKERPVPSGRIALETVWGWGLAWLALGVLSLLWLGEVTGRLGLVLTLCIVFYDALHKQI